MTLRDFLGIIRAPFLILAIVCILLGVSTAHLSGAELRWFDLFLVFAGGILAHISVNSLNEYFDFLSGLDFLTVKTPFSGGSGTLPAKPHLSKFALWIGVISLGVVAVIGLYFVYLRGIGMLIIGIAGIFTVLIYPVAGVKNWFLSLILPGLGFGISMVLGTHYALSGSINTSAIIASLIPFFLVNNLLLLNQLPDADADKKAGRENIVILIGKRRAVLVYTIFNIFAYLAIIIGVYFGYFNSISLSALLTSLIAIMASCRALKDSDDVKRLIPALAMNVLINLLTPFLVSISLIIGNHF